MKITVSIILPFYNADSYLDNAIQSVLNQTFENWELLLINDGSKDQSKEVALSFEDQRIRYFEQENKGVSSARNVGLNNMHGDYFCFLDADDYLPEESIESRLKIFDLNNELCFVDGRVLKMDSQLKFIIKDWRPIFSGCPFIDLIRMNGESFIGLTWMIKKPLNNFIQFNTTLTHGEDLLFLLQLAKTGGLYSYTCDPILKYRDTPNSAMTNLEGLEQGYRFIESQIQNWPEVGKSDLRIFRWKYKRAMTLAYLRKKSFQEAFKVWY